MSDDSLGSEAIVCNELVVAAGRGDHKGVQFLARRKGRGAVDPS